MEQNSTNWSLVATIVTGVLALLGILGFSQINKKIANVSKEVGELFTEFSTGISDGKLTSEEIAKVIQQFKELMAAVNAKEEVNKAK